MVARMNRRKLQPFQSAPLAATLLALTLGTGAGCGAALPTTATREAAATLPEADGKVDNGAGVPATRDSGELHFGALEFHKCEWLPQRSTSPGGHVYRHTQCVIHDGGKGPEVVLNYKVEDGSIVDTVTTPIAEDVTTFTAAANGAGNIELPDAVTNGLATHHIQYWVFTKTPRKKLVYSRIWIGGQFIAAPATSSAPSIRGLLDQHCPGPRS
jgi:hypothetical protein